MALVPPLSRDVPTTTVSPTSMVKLVSIIELRACGVVAAVPRRAGAARALLGQPHGQIFDLAVHPPQLHLELWYLGAR